MSTEEGIETVFEGRAPLFFLSLPFHLIHSFLGDSLFLRLLSRLLPLCPFSSPKQANYFCLCTFVPLYLYAFLPLYLFASVLCTFLPLNFVLFIESLPHPLFLMKDLPVSSPAQLLLLPTNRTAPRASLFCAFLQASPLLRPPPSLSPPFSLPPAPSPPPLSGSPFPSWQLWAAGGGVGRKDGRDYVSGV